jgi:hypothetical protein
MSETLALELGAVALKRLSWGVREWAWDQDINESKIALYLRIWGNIRIFRKEKIFHHLEKLKAKIIWISLIKI